MRLMACTLLVLLCSSNLFAVEKPETNKKKDYVSSYFVNADDAQSLPRFATKQKSSLKGLNAEGDSTCYTMHTLVAEKQRGSDETEIVKQRFCTPALQFELKQTTPPKK